MGKIVIIGASSGIGRELAIKYAEAGWTVGITARRIDRLEELKSKFPNLIQTQEMDITNIKASQTALENILSRLGSVDIIVLNSAAAYLGTSPTWEEEERVLSTNIIGTTFLANKAFEYFKRQGKGQIVGISSTAGTRGWGVSRTYAATKAYLSNYLEGLRICAALEGFKNIYVTDIRPGFIDTEMTAGMTGMFWTVSAERAAELIFSAIENKKYHAYIPKRWKYFTKWVRFLPEGFLISTPALKDARRFLPNQK